MPALLSVHIGARYRKLFLACLEKMKRQKNLREKMGKYTGFGAAGLLIAGLLALFSSRTSRFLRMALSAPTIVYSACLEPTHWPNACGIQTFLTVTRSTTGWILGAATKKPDKRRFILKRRGWLSYASPYEPRYRESYSSISELRYPLPANARSYELDEVKATFLFYGQEPVLRWHSSLGSNTEVCAVQFVDPERMDYRLRTFPDHKSALTEGYVVTHRYHCGTCSSLRDLAVYMAKPDLTKPARTCARKLTADGIKKCLMGKIGFAEPCAETWTYNVLHTRRQCMKICIDHYGFWNVLTNNMNDAHADKRGNLNPCLTCDEHASGPGFQYAAGTNAEEFRPALHYLPVGGGNLPVEHRLYFE